MTATQRWRVVCGKVVRVVLLERHPNDDVAAFEAATEAAWRDAAPGDFGQLLVACPHPDEPCRAIDDHGEEHPDDLFWRMPP